MKIVFAGSPEFAVPVLKALVAAESGVIAVITQPDKPVGRKRILTPTPVKKAAMELGLPVYDFEKIKNSVQQVKALNADLMITCAYGQILTQEVLDCFPQGVWNTHASLLPKFRGASPIQSAILAGESHTGITVMKTELELDSGDILLVKRCQTDDLSCGELSERLSVLAAEAAVEAVELLKKGENQLLMQDACNATYCKKIEKKDAKIDFNKSAEEVLRTIRAMNPEPLAYCYLNGTVLNILSAEYVAADGGAVGQVLTADKNGVVIKCGSAGINVKILKPAGGKEMRSQDFVNGRKIKAGDVLD